MGRIGTRVELSDYQRTKLKRFVSAGTHPARIIRRAQIILALDSSGGKIPPHQAEVAKRCGVSTVTVANVKSDFVNLSLPSFLERKKRKTPPVPAKIDGDYEAHLIALSCSEPPPGYARWTVRLLADRTVELGYIDSISHMSVSRILKKTNSSLT